MGTEKRLLKRSRIRRKKTAADKPGVDYTLLVTVIFLMFFGIIMIYSASAYESMLKFNDAQYYLRRQLIATAAAALALFICTWLDYKVFVKMAMPMIVISIVLVIIVMLTGEEVNGARRWIRIGAFSMQPAEVVKLSIIVYMSKFLTLIDKKDLETIPGLIKTVVPPAVMFLLIYKGTNNMSSGLIVLIIGLMMIFVASKNYRIYAAVTAIVGILGSIGLYLVIKSSEGGGFRIERIRAWIHPEEYASGRAFQTIQALYSIGSGGIYGKGLGQSLQKLGTLPEAQNDMIFSIICEELGLIGAAAVIFLFIILLYRIFIAAKNAPDVQAAFICVGVFAHIASQVVLNIAVVTNMIPNTGVTLPFISYGGTSVAFTMAEIGMVLNITGKSAALAEDGMS